MDCPHGGVIKDVASGSLGEEIGIEPGDILRSINGHCLRDVIDYQFYSDDEELELVLERSGKQHVIEVERDLDEHLGLDFTELVFDGMRLCRNRCEFCFVAQLRPGLRRSLYVRDDDYRYSFLSASYVTLTNLTRDDWARLEEQRLSPLYISVHATNLTVRRQLLGRPDAPDIMEQLKRLRELSIQVHCQIVICPGRNDGEVLKRSIRDLASLWPTVQTLALVPVGLTRFHQGDVRRVDVTEAKEIITATDCAAQDIRHLIGRTWVYPSDELYLLAGVDIPSQTFYDDDAQYGNGVGMVRDLLEDWADARPALENKNSRFTRVVIVTGELVAPILAKVAAEAARLLDIDLMVLPVANHFMGEMVTVAGLLAGVDVLSALADVDAEAVFLPRSMFDQDGVLTLDGMTWDQLVEAIGRPTFCGRGFSDIVAQLVKEDAIEQ